MPRPINKQELLKTAEEHFEKLFKLVDSISDNEEEQNLKFNFNEDFGKETPRATRYAHWARDKNLRDVFVHLYEWHRLLLNWIKANKNNENKPFLPEPYNWKTYGDMNVEFWKKHQNTSYEKSKEMVKESHKAVIKLVETFSNDELFSKGAFAWVGGSTLGQYCVSTTVAHYDWAMKKIKAHIKTYK